MSTGKTAASRLGWISERTGPGNDRVHGHSLALIRRYGYFPAALGAAYIFREAKNGANSRI